MAGETGEAAVANKAEDAAEGIWTLVRWLFIITAGFFGYAQPQFGIDVSKIVARILAIVKWAPAGFRADHALAGAGQAIVGGMIFAWATRTKSAALKLIGQVLGAMLLGRGVRLVISSVGA